MHIRAYRSSIIIAAAFTALISLFWLMPEFAFIFFIALLLSLLLSPIADRLARHMPRGLAAGLVVAAVVLAPLLVIEKNNLAIDIFSIVIAVVVTAGAALDIREAMAARRKSDEADMLSDMVAQMDALNRSLRAQRHDFLNHLQVVFSLIEMEEQQEAADYIEKV